MTLTWMAEQLAMAPGQTWPVDCTKQSLKSVTPLLVFNLREKVNVSKEIMKTFLLIAAAWIGLACIAELPTQPQMQEFAKKYKGAPSEEKRLLLCIDAINQGLVHRGGPVGNIDLIFGTDVSRQLPAKGQPDETGVVNFSNPRPAPPSDSIAAASTGWYLAFKFDQQGLIQNYYLSNLHK